MRRGYIGLGGQAAWAKFARRASLSARSCQNTLSSGPRPHSAFPFLPFDESPGREIHRNASAYGEPVFVVGGVPSPAFVGLHHIEREPTFGFHCDLGSAPCAFSAVLTT